MTSNIDLQERTETIRNKDSSADEVTALARCLAVMRCITAAEIGGSAPPASIGDRA
ncbi:hypothetical protein [Paraburkholderia sp.]|uniref:hypothetical protein n=1 Tax=Paraburkholderia sp. TaxID=1926495 RepID=UPI0025FF6517|nr:hypothetical protein [Paraburkholderia sp.]